MSTKKLLPYEGVDFDEDLQIQLTNPEFASGYINSVIEDNDPAYLKIALRRIARAYGIAKIAEKSGLGREAIYKMLSEEGNPSFGNIVKILSACGLEFSFRPASVSSIKPMAPNYLGRIAKISNSTRLKSRVEDVAQRYLNSGVASKGVKKNVSKKTAKKTTKKIATKKMSANFR